MGTHLRGVSSIAFLQSAPALMVSCLARNNNKSATHTPAASTCFKHLYARRLERLPDAFLDLEPAVFLLLAVLRAAVLLLADFLAVDLRAVVLRPVDLRPVDLRLVVALVRFLVAPPLLCNACRRFDI
jgi:hypothetical protein